VAVDDELGREVGHGRVLTRDRLGLMGPGPWAVLDARGHLLAVYESHHAETAKPVVVLTGG
jgi:hypothetical protein